MDELIRKQDALDAFNGNVTISAPRNAGRVYTYLKMVTDRIKALPAVYVPDTNVGDMIYRQAATTIPVMPKEHRHYQTNNLDDAYEHGWNDLQECIENLPTVQPEITHEQAIDYLHKTGWLQNHDRILTESKVPLKGTWKDFTDEGYVECPFCKSATNCESEEEIDDIHFCFSCGAMLKRGDADGTD